MVAPFQFARIPMIIFGAGKINEITGIIKTYGTNLLLVTGRQSFIQSPAYEMFTGSLKEKGVSWYHVIIPAEPSPEMIDREVARLNTEKVDLVVGIGGGSVLDAGKAISAMMYKQESVEDFLEGVGILEHPGTKLPFIAVPTTSGTGSEATKNAVISRIGPNGFKRSLRHDNFVPDIAVVDPELTLGCPEEITAASGMDCYTQLMEAYLSTKSNPYSDALAFEGLKAIKSSLLKSYNNGQDIESRAGMSFAALTSGICLANAGLGVVHGFAASIGGMYDIPHGVVCGTLMAKTNEVIVREMRKTGNYGRGLKKYAILGRLFIDVEGRGDDYYIDGFISHLHELTNKLQLPGLRQFDFKEEDIKLICKTTDNKNNPVNLTTENLIEIINYRLTRF
jgi:alcohol dehydrogenase class IV